MTESQYFLQEPPFVNIDEIIDWIERTIISDAGHGDLQSILDCIAALEKKLYRGELEAYGSIDTSPVQPIDQWTWSEFEILQADLGANIVVRSSKSYRASALKDLSQPSKEWVAGLGGIEKGYHRVMDQIVFFDTEVQRVFPIDGVSIQSEPSSNKYAEALREIEGGKYLHRHEPLSQADVSRLIYDYWKAQNRKPQTTLSTIQRNISRHYANFGKIGH